MYLPAKTCAGINHALCGNVGHRDDEMRERIVFGFREAVSVAWVHPKAAPRTPNKPIPSDLSIEKSGFLNNDLLQF